jgi:hypothetical protein
MCECRSDAAPLLLILTLGITNGHLVSLASMHMPSLLPLEQRCAPYLSLASCAHVRFLSGLCNVCSSASVPCMVGLLYQLPCPIPYVTLYGT